jgi:CRISPR-associated protein Cas1
MSMYWAGFILPVIKRTIEVSGPDTRLSLRQGQVRVEREHQPVGQFPAEDVGVLIVDAPTTQYTHATLVELVNQGAIVVLCGADHLPAAFVTPCAGNSLQVLRLAAQVNAKLPLKKRLWQQLVKAKVRNQAGNLPEDGDVRPRLLALAERARSGDPENVEAQAARLYWPAWLPDRDAPFLRRRDGEPPNQLLNYGYAVLRAAVARALAGAGLHPSIGLHHHNRYDAFCLADDLMEPLRPLVDRRVRELWKAGRTEIDKETRRDLLSILTATVATGEGTGPLMVALERMAASLVECFEARGRQLEVPRLWTSADTDSCGSS